MLRACVALLLVSLLGLVGCDPAAPAGPAAPLREPQPLRLGETTIQAEIALSETEQRVGLMHRDELAPDHGMLFVYEEPQRLSFWMKNTLIPLDLGFFDAEGVLLQVVRLYPHDQTAKSSASEAVQFGLEMNQGWFRAQGITPGAQLDLETVRTAIARRGVDPAEFGL